jgi:Domain of unknown function (DUF4266)
MKLLARLVLIVAAANLAACAQVKPWERGNLARPEMGFSDDGLERKIRDHVNHSKEASSSVVAGSGGGCGCN